MRGFAATPRAWEEAADELAAVLGTSRRDALGLVAVYRALVERAAGRTGQLDRDRIVRVLGAAEADALEAAGLWTDGTAVGWMDEVGHYEAAHERKRAADRARKEQSRGRPTEVAAPSDGSRAEVAPSRIAPTDRPTYLPTYPPDPPKKLGSEPKHGSPSDPGAKDPGDGAPGDEEVHLGEVVSGRAAKVTRRKGTCDGGITGRLGDVWAAVTKGRAPYGQIGKELLPLIERDGGDEEDAARRIRAYLAHCPHHMATPAGLARSWGKWGPQDGAGDLLRKLFPDEPPKGGPR